MAYNFRARSLMFSILLLSGFSYCAVGISASVFAYEALPQEFSKFLGSKKIVIERVAPHYSKFLEERRVYQSLQKSPSFQTRWVEIDPRSEVPKNLSPELRECWFAVSSGAKSCSLSEVRKIESQIMTEGFREKTDLLLESRKWVKKVGLRRTRDLMVRALGKLDDDKGFFEKRIHQVRKNSQLIFEDSIMNVNPKERAKIGLFFALGYTHHVGIPSKIVRQMVSRAKELGFYAKHFDTAPVGTTQSNAVILARELRQDIQKVDSFFLIGASKGGHEITHFYLNSLSQWSEEERSKLHGVLSMSGVLRSAYMGDWVATAPGVAMSLLRSISRIQTHENKNLDGLGSTRIDAYEGYEFQKLPKMHNNFVWVNFSMLPSGEDGHIPDSAVLSKYSRYAMNFLKDRGPSDGLVETAGTVLPPKTGIRQWVVRGWGSHLPTYGQFIDGTSVADIGSGSDEEVVASGSRTIEALLRAILSGPRRGDTKAA